MEKIHNSNNRNIIVCPLCRQKINTINYCDKSINLIDGLPPQRITHVIGGSPPTSPSRIPSICKLYDDRGDSGDSDYSYDSDDDIIDDDIIEATTCSENKTQTPPVPEKGKYFGTKTRLGQYEYSILSSTNNKRHVNDVIMDSTLAIYGKTYPTQDSKLYMVNSNDHNDIKDNDGLILSLLKPDVGRRVRRNAIKQAGVEKLKGVIYDNFKADYVCWPRCLMENHWYIVLINNKENEFYSINYKGIWDGACKKDVIRISNWLKVLAKINEDENHVEKLSKYTYLNIPRQNSSNCGIASLRTVEEFLKNHTISISSREQEIEYAEALISLFKETEEFRE